MQMLTAAAAAASRRKPHSIHQRVVVRLAFYLLIKKKTLTLPFTETVV